MEIRKHLKHALKLLTDSMGGTCQNAAEKPVDLRQIHKFENRLAIACTANSVNDVILDSPGYI